MTVSRARQDGDAWRADEHPRPGSTLEALAKLPLTFPVVEGQPGIITAGSASGITDGGAAVVLSTATVGSARTA